MYEGLELLQSRVRELFFVPVVVLLVGFTKTPAPLPEGHSHQEGFVGQLGSGRRGLPFHAVRALVQGRGLRSRGTAEASGGPPFRGALNAVAPQ